MKNALSKLKNRQDGNERRVRRRLHSDPLENSPVGSPNLSKLQSQLNHVHKFSQEDVFKVRPKLVRSPDKPLQPSAGSATDSPFSLATESSDDKSLNNTSHSIKPRNFPIPKLNLSRELPAKKVISHPRFNAIPRPHSARSVQSRMSSTAPMLARSFNNRNGSAERSFNMHSRSHSTSDLKADPAKLYSRTQFRPAPPLNSRPDRSHSRNNSRHDPSFMHRDGPSLSRDPSRERFMGRVPSDGNLSRMSGYDRQCHSARGPPRNRRQGSLGGYNDYRNLEKPPQANSVVLGWENQEVVNWITSLGGDMAVYAPIFEENDLNGEDLISLNREILKEMGIRKLGHQNRILRARDIFCGDVRLPNSAESELEQEIREKNDHITELKTELRNVYHALATLQRNLEPYI